MFLQQKHKIYEAINEENKKQIRAEPFWILGQAYVQFLLLRIADKAKETHAKKEDSRNIRLSQLKLE